MDIIEGSKAVAIGPSWNPLRCSGTALPVNLLVIAKAIAIALLLSGHLGLQPAAFLPGLDHFPPLLFQRTLQLVFVTSAVALLFNRSVRLAAFMLGVTMIVSALPSIFCGVILILVGLYEPGREWWAIRRKLVLLYFCTGLSELLDGDWRSGVFFETSAKMISWFAIVGELGLSGVFLVRRLYPLAIWGSLLLHFGMLLFTGSAFLIFFYAMTASMLAFARWPTSPMLVIFDGDCGFCALTKGWVERFDLEKVLQWQPYQSGVGKRYGITDEDASRRLYLVHSYSGGDRVYSGFGAFKMIVLCNPISYLLTYTVLASQGAGASRFRNVVVALLLFLFSPLFRPVGDALYALIARHRRSLVANSNCSIE